MAKLRHFDILKIKHFVIIITILVFLSCKQQTAQLHEVVGQRLTIDTTITVVDSIARFIKPYHDRVESILDSTIAYAPHTISKTDGALNSSAGNLMADIVMKQTAPLLKQVNGADLDFVLLNHGGIRSIISKGNINPGTAYEVMPFENTIVVVELTASSVEKLVAYLVAAKRAHPVSGIQLILNKDNSVKSFTINGQPLKKDHTYMVATSNYLVNGGDNMDFFAEAISKKETFYKIRSAMIDYFLKTDTIAAKVDQRFYKLD